MAEPVYPAVVRAKLRWNGVERRDHIDGTHNFAPLVAAGARTPPLPGGAGGPVKTAPLISRPDAAISRDLREQTQRVLETLMPQEEQVLRLRFGIGVRMGCSMIEISRRFALPMGRIMEIESGALRKLRNPGLQRVRDTTGA